MEDLWQVYYQIKYKYLSCDKDYSYKLDEKLKKQFKNLMILINLFCC